MRISLIYGENIGKSYERYTDLLNQSKKRGFKISPITDIKNIVNQSLFDEKVVFTLDKPNKIKLTDWKWLNQNAKKHSSNILIYYEGNPGITITKNLPKDAKKEKFEYPKIIFQFLDNFYPKNSVKTLKLLTDLAENEPIELVFHLLGRHLRDLYWAKISPETMQTPSWRTSKLKSQSSKFTSEQLKNTINELSEIDIKSKTTNTSLKNSLDMLIIKSLK